jgi:hypothetical protein
MPYTSQSNSPPKPLQTSVHEFSGGTDFQPKPFNFSQREFSGGTPKTYDR